MSFEDFLNRRPAVERSEAGADPGLVWFDPGGTTGWCVVTVHPDALLRPDIPMLPNILHCAAGHFGGSEADNIRQCLELIADWPGLVVGVESFRLRSRVSSTELLSPVRIRAVLDYACWLDRKPVVVQAPATALSAMTDDRLRKMGFLQYDSGVGGKINTSAGGRLALHKNGLEGDHAYDALRHALTYLKRCKEKRALGIPLLREAGIKVEN